METNNKKYVTIKLRGGLGNQLFQIFTTIAYALKHDRTFIFSYSDKLTVGKERPTYWSNFLYNLKQFTNFNITDTKFQTRNLNTLEKIKEKNHNYNELPKSELSLFTLYGYFQSPKYFDIYNDYLFTLINLKEQQDIIKKNIIIYLIIIKL